MPDAVDDAGREDRYPEHLHRPDRDADGPEQQHVNGKHQGDALAAVRRVHVALQPVVRRAVAVLVEGRAVFRLFAVELRPLEQHAADAVDLRTVRVLRRLDLGVVFAVDGGPLLGNHAGREPQPEAEEVRNRRMQIKRAVRLVAVQVNRHRRNRDVREPERSQHVAPPRQHQ